ncbi:MULTISPECIES: serine/threonine-protein kinase [unclassified Nocardia]|uniref:serine/threonine-protein kinase n=1 Tax=unclassified Nocardia TaxID=2637762 RepID=UPI0027E00293|nr:MULTISPECIES: serine/threonine-protein kinase [unclassified Nocardia]
MVHPDIGATFADYVIEGVLGRGGMGTVYLARHPRLPRWVALKLLNREVSGDAELRRRFEQEANVVARLEHPNIVGVYDRGTHAGHLWVAMQYIQGSDIGRLDPRAVTSDRAARIITETAAALDYAHARGVLHRDIKPANILLAAPEAGRDERAVLTDFGIARLLDATTKITATGTFTATLAYAAPEQLTGQPLDHRADQYSLACTLFTLLAGQSPFAADNPGQVVAGHLNAPLPSLSRIRPDLPVRLDAVLARGMAKHRDQRFSSCSEFAAFVRDAVSERAVAAPPQSSETFVLRDVSVPQAERRSVPRHPMPPRSSLPSPYSSPRTSSNKTRWLVGGAVALVVAIGVVVGAVMLIDGESKRAADRYAMPGVIDSCSLIDPSVLLKWGTTGPREAPKHTESPPDPEMGGGSLSCSAAYRWNGDYGDQTSTMTLDAEFDRKPAYQNDYTNIYKLWQQSGTGPANTKGTGDLSGVGSNGFWAWGQTQFGGFLSMGYLCAAKDSNLAAEIEFRIVAVAAPSTDDLQASCKAQLRTVLERLRK